MPIAYIRKSNLPYDFALTNYENSAANYDNSIVNCDNSGANYENSSSNYENGPNGNHRLYYLPDNIHMTWAGYYGEPRL